MAYRESNGHVAMSTRPTPKSIKEKQLPANSVSIESF